MEAASKLRGNTDWDRIANLTDEEIDAAIADDPDCWAPTEEEMADALKRIKAEHASKAAAQ